MNVSKPIPFFLTILLSAVAVTHGFCQTSTNDNDGVQWFRGNLHTHSFWSDGNDFPEMIAKWYVDHDYDFLGLSDHNILSRGDKWMAEETILRRGGQVCIDKFRKAFGEEWVQVREKDGEQQYRLTPLDEIRERFEKPGEFLMLEAEEISDSVDGFPVHLNATNLAELLQPTGGATVREAIDANLRAAAEQAARSGRQILVHLNHPNFGWAITAEDLAAVTRERFFEVYNGHPGINHLGDKERPSIERMWDIVNTLRIDKFLSPPVYGLGTDDCHNYHGKPGSQPGRGWVMVRARSLTADDLITAMMQGDFYASSGVELSDVQFDQASQTLSIQIKGKPGVTYETHFIGTRKGYDESSEPRRDADGNSIRGSRTYSAEVGEILQQDTSLEPSYQMQGDELYVRALITSSEDHPNPSFDGQKTQAWTQPVGWE